MKRIISTVLVGLVGLNATLQANPTKPSLVVTIMVDQLRTDYIDFLREMFGEGGLKLLTDSGLMMRNVDFGVKDLDSGVATAEIMSGSYPRTNGVTAVLTATTELTPDRLTVSTLGDEVVIDGGGMAKLCAIAPDRATAVTLGGHTEGTVIWLDTNTGQWATDSYYSPKPSLRRLTDPAMSIAARIDTMVWKPLLAPESYPVVSPQKKFYPFRYGFPSRERSVYTRFTSTPLVNREITDLAIDCLNSLRLGNRGSDATDMLNIGLTVAPFKQATDGNYRLELADSYLRLDRDLERLFRTIDTNVGLDRTVIFLSSTGYCDEAVADDARYRIPGGELSLKRMKSLLNSFLSAKYGNGDYVESIKGGALRFNSKSIDEKRLSHRELVDESRLFLSRMSGVARVFTLEEILSGTTPEARKLFLGTDPHDASDLVVEYQPGWTVTDDTQYPPQKRVERTSAVATPAFIYAPDLPAETVVTPVDATSLAATVAGIMRIRSPNAAGIPIR